MTKTKCKNCTCVENKDVVKLSSNVDIITAGVDSLLLRATIAEKALELACDGRDCYAIVHGKENCLNPDKCIGSKRCYMKHFLHKATVLADMNSKLMKF